MRVSTTLTVALSRILERVARFFNPVMRRLLASRFSGPMSRRLMLLSFTGRRTGRSYTTPVSYVREGSSLFVPGGGAWRKNLGGGRAAEVRLMGVWRPVTSEVISEPVAMADVLSRMLAANPAIAVFTGIRPGPGGRPDPAGLERERRRGFVVVRLHLKA